jgi:hypothetical protein
MKTLLLTIAALFLFYTGASHEANHEFQKGKTRGPGIMAPKDHKQIEMETARQLFLGPMRDPFRRMK